MRYSSSRAALLLGVLSIVFFDAPAAAETVESAASPEYFESRIVPILAQRCLGCHSTAEEKGGLDLSSASSSLRGGDSGAAIVPGDADKSLLVDRVAKGEMPPPEDEAIESLTKDEIDALKSWIAAGAAWPTGRTVSPYEFTTAARSGRDWWSLQPVSRPALPTVAAAGRIDQSPDAFILARLEAEGMTLAPPADRRTLIRRAYFDLIGLPPTIDDVLAFERDESPDAYARLIDRLLASPQYGERWARYWLDLVRFAETNGYERDATKPFAWRYRDYVVRSLNDDKPYDRFVLEQLAGDELPDRSFDTVVATGFMRLATWDDEPNDRKEYRYERLEDLVHTTSSTFLAYTVKCARCHDHKFDPIPQQDYYSMASIFWAGYIEGGKLMGGPDFEQLGFKALGWTDRGREVDPLALLKKGDPSRPLDPVDPAAPTMVRTLRAAFDPPAADATTTERRLQLARWIVDERNPLTARVMVNRIWQHHFGRGIVASPNNFGFKGEPPTHPKLLDWLASEFIAGGWRLKHLHRLIMLSSTYKQSSLHPDAARLNDIDAANRLLWRAPRRRLDAEAMRDSMLSVSGELRLEVGGPSFFPRISHEALVGLSRRGATWGASPAEERRRRSIYIFTKRSLLPPLMTTFDFCDTTTSCAKRDISTVAPQALALLNNHFVHGRSEAMATRILAEVDAEPAAIAERAWQLAFARTPTEVERAGAVEHMREQTAHFAAAAARRARKPPSELTVRDGLALWLRADEGIEVDASGRVGGWASRSGGGFSAAQSEVSRRPLYVKSGINGRAVVRFDGRGRFLRLRGRLLSAQRCSVFAVVTDSGTTGHREVISNWSPQNSVTSFFVGTTGFGQLRFSDDFAGVGELLSPQRASLITAISGERDALLFQNDRLLVQKGAMLAKRNLEGEYVIGRQGALDGEYWHGDIGEILVYNRQLNDSEREAVWNYLNAQYRLQETAREPEFLAVASLCHVLLNANEFVYVD